MKIQVNPFEFCSAKAAEAQDQLHLALKIFLVIFRAFSFIESTGISQ